MRFAITNDAGFAAISDDGLVAAWAVPGSRHAQDARRDPRTQQAIACEMLAREGAWHRQHTGNCGDCELCRAAAADRRFVARKIRDAAFLASFKPRASRALRGARR